MISTKSYWMRFNLTSNAVNLNLAELYQDNPLRKRKNTS